MSCEKGDDWCGDCPIIYDSNYNDRDTILQKNVAGELQITVRVGKFDGELADGATVKLAYTFDSISQEKLFYL